MPEPSVAPALPPWWLDEALAHEGDPAPAPPLEGEVRADVAIIGGGYTGLWTALAIKELEPSASVVVLESEICGWGPSGRNGGFLHGYWTHLSRLRAVARGRGRARGRARLRRGHSVGPRVLRGARRRRLVTRGRLPQGLELPGAGRGRREVRAHRGRARRARGGRAALGRRTSRPAAARRVSAAASSSATARPSSRRG